MRPRLLGAVCPAGKAPGARRRSPAAGRDVHCGAAPRLRRFFDAAGCLLPGAVASRRGHPVCAVFVVVDVAAAAVAAVVVVVVVAAAQAVEVRDSEDEDEDYEMTHGGRSDGADGETMDGDHSDGADDHDWPGAHVSWDGFWNFGAEDDPRLARPGSMWVSGYVAEDDPLEHRGKVFPRGPEAPPGGDMV